jgi:predicted nucleic acid-binding protein
MTTSIDTNIIVALWLSADPLNHVATRLLTQARSQGNLVILAPVYAELMSDPNRDEVALDEFLQDTGITVDWILDESAWREAGRANCGYVQRRRLGRGTMARHILTDFLIGAHALIRGYNLLTFDQRLYAAAFPKLTIVAN